MITGAGQLTGLSPCNGEFILGWIVFDGAVVVGLGLGLVVAPYREGGRWLVDVGDAEECGHEWSRYRAGAVPAAAMAPTGLNLSTAPAVPDLG